MRVIYLLCVCFFLLTSCEESEPPTLIVSDRVPAHFLLASDSLSVTPIELKKQNEIVLLHDSNLLVTMHEADWLPESEISLRTSWNNTNNTVNWNTGDRIGIFMKNTGGTTLSTNVRYDVLGGGTPLEVLTPSGAPIYFPFPPSESVNFYAYYPHGTSITSTTINYTLSGTQSTAAQLANVDWMYATPVTTNALSPNVTLTFNHVMTMISFRVKTQTGTATMSQVRLTGQSVTNRGSLNIMTGTLTPLTNTFTATSTKTQTINSTAPGYADLIINPCSFNGSLNNTGNRFRAIISTSSPNGNYSTNLGLNSGTITFESGKRYTFTVTILAL